MNSDNIFLWLLLSPLEDRSTMVRPSVTAAGDCLTGFLLETRHALYEERRDSVILTLGEIFPFSIGVLIAPFERAAGFYSSLISVNAYYYQLGVEAGKKVTEKVIELQPRSIRGSSMGYAEIADEIEPRDEVESGFQIREHRSSNVEHGIRESRRNGSNLDSDYIME